MNHHEEPLSQWILDADQSAAQAGSGTPEQNRVGHVWSALAQQAGSLRMDPVIDRELLRRLRRPGSEGGLVIPLLHLAAVLLALVTLAPAMEPHRVAGWITATAQQQRAPILAGQTVHAAGTPMALLLPGGASLDLQSGSMELVDATEWKALSGAEFTAQFGTRLTALTMGEHEVRGRDARFRASLGRDGSIHIQVDDGVVDLDGHRLRRQGSQNLPRASIRTGVVLPTPLDGGPVGGGWADHSSGLSATQPGVGDSDPGLGLIRTPVTPASPQPFSGGQGIVGKLATELLGCVTAHGTNQPVQDALVRAVRLPAVPGGDGSGPPGDEGDTEGLTFTTITDKEGRFHFSRLCSGLYQVQVLVAPWDLWADSLVHEILVEGGGTVSLPIELLAGFTFQGRLLDSSGVPLLDALVTGPTRSAVTDAAGWFTLHGLPATGANLAIEADGLLPLTIQASPSNTGRTWSLDWADAFGVGGPGEGGTFSGNRGFQGGGGNGGDAGPGSGGTGPEGIGGNTIEPQAPVEPVTGIPDNGGGTKPSTSPSSGLSP